VPDNVNTRFFAHWDTFQRSVFKLENNWTDVQYRFVGYFPWTLLFNINGLEAGSLILGYIYEVLGGVDAIVFIVE